MHQCTQLACIWYSWQKQHQNTPEVSQTLLLTGCRSCRYDQHSYFLLLARMSRLPTAPTGLAETKHGTKEWASKGFNLHIAQGHGVIAEVYQAQLWKAKSLVLLGSSIWRCELWRFPRDNKTPHESLGLFASGLTLPSTVPKSEGQEYANLLFYAVRFIFWIGMSLQPAWVGLYFTPDISYKLRENHVKPREWWACLIMGVRHAARKAGAKVMRAQTHLILGSHSHVNPWKKRYSSKLRIPNK